MFNLKNSVLACLILGLLSLSPQAKSAPEEDYRFGPQDKLQIKVFDLRNSSGEAYQWPAFNSEYIVSSTGSISLPLIGEVVAAGKTSRELQDDISNQLRVKVGLAQRPSTTVQVLQYRSFYIMGSVQNPGEFEFRPGLSAIQAVSAAGGLLRVQALEDFSLKRALLSTISDLKSLKIQISGLMVRHSRLMAEAEDEDKVKFPPELKEAMKESSILSLMREEDSLFTKRRNIVKSKISILETARSNLESQIKSLDIKEANSNRQSELAKNELRQVNDLLSKGLVASPRQLATEQMLSNYESIRLDTQIAKLRAQQELSKVGRDIVDTKDLFKSEALSDASNISGKLNELLVKKNYLEQQVAQIRLQQSSSDSQPLSSPFVKFEVSSEFDKRGARPMAFDEKVQPGDVINVLIDRKALIQYDDGSDKSIDSQ